MTYEVFPNVLKVS